MLPSTFNGTMENDSLPNCTASYQAKNLLERTPDLPSITGFGWELLRRSEGLKRVRSLKLQLFWTLVGLPSAVMSVLGDLLSPTDACLLLMLWPLGLAMRTRSLKLSFWLWKTEPKLFHHKPLSFRRGRMLGWNSEAVYINRQEHVQQVGARNRFFSPYWKKREELHLIMVFIFIFEISLTLKSTCMPLGFMQEGKWSGRALCTQFHWR